MKNSSPNVYFLLALLVLPVSNALCCTAVSQWSSALDMYNEAIAVFSGEIKFMKSGDYYLYKLEDVYETEQDDATAYLIVDEIWKNNKKNQIIGINKALQDFSVDKVVANQKYIFFICKNTNKDLSKEKYTACDIWDYKNGRTNVLMIKAYLSGGQRYREEVEKEDNRQSVAACIEIMTEPKY